MYVMTRCRGVDIRMFFHRAGPPQVNASSRYFTAEGVRPTEDKQLVREISRLSVISCNELDCHQALPTMSTVAGNSTLPLT